MAETERDRQRARDCGERRRHDGSEAHERALADGRGIEASSIWRAVTPCAAAVPCRLYTLTSQVPGQPATVVCKTLRARLSRAIDAVISTAGTPSSRASRDGLA